MGLLDDRVIIITGAARGIGKAYALGMAAEGGRIVVADLADGSDTVAEIEAAGGTAAAFSVNVADEAATEAMADFAVERFGKLDVLINNAALFTTIVMGPFDEISVEDWDRVFAVNVRGSWLAAKAAARHMKEQRSGKIINISSMTVPDGTPGFAHYVASKAAVVGLTRALARELGPWNISVNTLTPDFIAHDPDVRAANEGVDELLSERRSFVRSQEPEDMVGTAIYLAGSQSDFVTGQNFYVNGGRWFG